MLVSLETRKPIDEITVEDLAIFPIWEFTLDEEANEDQDETYVRPVNTTTIPLDSYSLSVAAVFITASGLKINGLVEVNTYDDIEIGHAALLFKGQYIFVPSTEFEVVSTEYDRISSRLGLSKDAVFPLHFKLVIPIEGQVHRIEGVFSSK